MVWLKIGLAFVVLFALMSLVKFSLRKIFEIENEKQGWVSYNHINKTHRKVDSFVRVLKALTLIIVLYLTMFKAYPIALVLTALILLPVLDYSVRAFFGWKYSDNPKQSILTMGEMLVFVTALAVTIQFDLVNLVY